MPPQAYGGGYAIIEPVKEEAPAPRAGRTGLYFLKEERGLDGMTDRVKECVHTEYTSCRGCSWSYKTSLFDGGCKLHYEKNTEWAGKSKDDTETENGGELHADFSNIQSGNRVFLKKGEELS